MKILDGIEYVTVLEACVMVGVCEQYFKRLVKERGLKRCDKGFKFNQSFYNKLDIEKMVEERRAK